VPTQGEWQYALKQSQFLLILALLVLILAIIVTLMGSTFELGPASSVTSLPLVALLAILKLI
jgi:hypothetical protein